MGTAHKTKRILAFLQPQGLDVSISPASTFCPPSEIVWIPIGESLISAGGGVDGKGFVGNVVCDEAAFNLIAASYADEIALGRRVWIDFNHDDAEASGWITGFRWDASKGIIALVEWTSEGCEALEGKAYYSFSPAFLIDQETSRPCSLIPGHAAGGLVNAPAFGARMPALIAARLGNASTTDAKSDLSLSASVEAKTASGGLPDSTNTDIQMSDKNIDTAAVKAAAEEPSLKSVMDSITALAASVKALQADVGEEKKKEEEKVAASTLKPSAPVMPEVAPISPKVEVVSASLESVLKGYAANVRDTRKKAAIFARDIAPRLGRDFTGQNISQVLAANGLGTLSGDLVAQKSLLLLKYKFPILSRVTTDFSDLGGQFNQTIRTRTRAIPSAADFVAGTGYGSANYDATDVPVTLSNNKGVQISFNANELAATSRGLFDEASEGQINGLIKAMVDSLYATITAGNFSNATTSAAVASTGLTRAEVVKIGVELDKRYASQENRTLILNSDALGALFSDPTVISLAAYQRAEIIEKQTLPLIAGFGVIQQPFFPSASKLIGFGFAPDALVIAARPTNDYSSAIPGSNNGSVSLVTDPDTGLTVQVVEYVNHETASATRRVSLMYGVAKGQVASGQRLVTT